MINKGDWVRINCPEKPWLHGGEGEVVQVYESHNPMWGGCDVEFSRTPGWPITRWRFENVIVLSGETMPEEYYA